MPLVATASKTVRNKNIVLILMCAAFAAWFGYDGFVAWPAANKASVERAKQDPKHIFDAATHMQLESWTPDSNPEDLRDKLKRGGDEYAFHTDTDLMVQKLIVIVLSVATVGAVVFYINCQKRRAILDVEARTLSPKNGLVIPIDEITVIDNTRWKKTGIVDLTYKTAAGVVGETELDDYKLDGLPPLLNELSTLAEKAELIPPPGAAGATEASA